MLSGADCQAKAREALVRAGDITDPELRKYWEDTAVEWAGLAVQAEIQEDIQKEMPERNPD
jgi:hypothetical protein